MKLKKGYGLIELLNVIDQVMTTRKKVKTSDSGGVVSGRCVIMSLVDGRTEKAHVTCKERERDKKEYAREEPRGKTGDTVLCK